MIDLHCHLIWGVDDGCQTREDALAMARALVDAGVHTVACTPHLRHDKSWVNKRGDNLRRLEELRGALEEARIALKVFSGSEHYLTPELMDHLSAAEHTTYGQTQYLLVEIPYSGPPPDLPGVLYRFRRQRLHPVLAHVERYGEVGLDLRALKVLHEQGHVLQINLGSLTGYYGKVYQKAALKILDEGLAHLVAGDCHGPQDPGDIIPSGMAALRKRVGPQAADILSEMNPKAILDGQPVRDLV